MKKRTPPMPGGFRLPREWKGRRFQLFEPDTAEMSVLAFYPPKSFADWQIPSNEKGEVLSVIYGDAEFDAYLHWLADYLLDRTDLLTDAQAWYVRGMEAKAFDAGRKTAKDAAKAILFWISEWVLVEHAGLCEREWRELWDVPYDAYAGALGDDRTHELWYPYILYGDTSAQTGLRVWDPRKGEEERDAGRHYLLTECFYQQMRYENWESFHVPSDYERIDVGYRGIFAHCLQQIPKHKDRFDTLKFFYGNYIENMYK